MPFCVNDYKPFACEVVNNRTKKIYSAISFTTMQLPCFNVFRELFYLSNVKVVPNNIYDLLTPRGLARPLGLELWTMEVVMVPDYILVYMHFLMMM